MTDLIFVPELGLLGPSVPQRRGRSLPTRSAKQRVVVSTVPPTPEPLYFQPMLIPHPPSLALQQTPKFKSPTPKMHYMKEYYKRYEGMIQRVSRSRQAPATMRAASSGMKHRKRGLMRDRRFPEDSFRFPGEDTSAFRPKTAPIDIVDTIRLYTARHNAL